MPLIREDDVVRIDLPAGEWVDVKRQLSKGDRTRITAAAIRMRVAIGSGDVAGEQTFDEATYDAVTFRALEIALRRWSFDDPITPENIRRLDEASYDRIAEETKRLWEPLPEPEKNG